MCVWCVLIFWQYLRTRISSCLFVSAVLSWQGSCSTARAAWSSSIHHACCRPEHSLGRLLLLLLLLNWMDGGEKLLSQACLFLSYFVIHFSFLRYSLSLFIFFFFDGLPFPEKKMKNEAARNALLSFWGRGGSFEICNLIARLTTHTLSDIILSTQSFFLFFSLLVSSPWVSLREKSKRERLSQNFFGLGHRYNTLHLTFFPGIDGQGRRGKSYQISCIVQKKFRPSEAGCSRDMH